jgi:glycosyltransferase involved in cell wall biosynthesis
MPEVVLDGVNGLLIPPADAAAIEKSALRLAHSPDLRQRFGLAAQHAMSGYTWERSAQALERLFRRIIIDSKGLSPE